MHSLLMSLATQKNHPPNILLRLPPAQIGPPLRRLEDYAHAMPLFRLMLHSHLIVHLSISKLDPTRKVEQRLTRVKRFIKHFMHHCAPVIVDPGPLTRNRHLDGYRC
jgi:hypothetical protein